MEIIVREADPAEFEVIGEIAVAAYRTIDPDLGGYDRAGTRARRDLGRRHAPGLRAPAFLTGVVMNPA